MIDLKQKLTDLIEGYELNRGGGYYGDDDFLAGEAFGIENACEDAREAIQRVRDELKGKTVLVLSREDYERVLSFIPNMPHRNRRLREELQTNDPPE